MAPKPRMDAILTMEPPCPRVAMRRAASWPTRNTPSRLTAMTSRHSCSLVLAKNEPDGTPALLTRIEMGPDTASPASNALVTEPLSVTSSATAQALPPAPRISASNSRRRSMRRAASTTAAPAPARTRAKCCPRPDDAPVTRAVLPASENSVFAILPSMPLKQIGKPDAASRATDCGPSSLLPTRPPVPGLTIGPERNWLSETGDVACISEIAEAHAPFHRSSSQRDGNALDPEQRRADGHFQVLGRRVVGRNGGEAILHLHDQHAIELLVELVERAGQRL